MKGNLVKLLILAAVLVPGATFSEMSTATLKLRDGRTLQGEYLGGTVDVIRLLIGGEVQEIPVRAVSTLDFNKQDAAPAVPMSAAPARKPSSATAPPAPPPSGPLTVSAGTRLMVRLDRAIDTGTAKTGERFKATLDVDLVASNGVIVARSGVKVYGKVVESVKAGRVRGRAKLSIELTDVSINDQLLPIVSDQIAYEGERSGTLKKVGAGAAIGAIADGSDGAKVGTAVGLGAAVLTKGKQIQFAAGTVLEFRTLQPLSIQ